MQMFPYRLLTELKIIIRCGVKLANICDRLAEVEAEGVSTVEAATAAAIRLGVEREELAEHLIGIKV